MARINKLEDYFSRMEAEKSTINTKMDQIELESEIVITDNHKLKTELKQKESTIEELEKQLALLNGNPDPLSRSKIDSIHSNKMLNIQLDSDLQRANSIIESLKKENAGLKSKLSDSSDDRKAESGSMANLSSSKVANYYKFRDTSKQSNSNLPLSFCGDDLAGGKLRPVRVNTQSSGGHEREGIVERKLEMSQVMGLAESTLMGRVC